MGSSMEDLFATMESAIATAASKYPEEFIAKRPKILQLLFEKPLIIAPPLVARKPEDDVPKKPRLIIKIKLNNKNKENLSEAETPVTKEKIQTTPITKEKTQTTPVTKEKIQTTPVTKEKPQPQTRSLPESQKTKNLHMRSEGSKRNQPLINKADETLKFEATKRKFEQRCVELKQAKRKVQTLAFCDLPELDVATLTANKDRTKPFRHRSFSRTNSRF